MVADSTGVAFTLTLPAGAAAGNAIVVCLEGMNGTYSVADDKAEAYTSAVSVDSVPDALHAEVFFFLNVAAGAKVITVTPPAAGTTARAQEWSGLVTAGAVDQTQTASGAGSSPTSGTTAATTQASELVIAVFVDNTGLNPETITDPAGYTNIFTQTNGVNFFGGGAVQKVVAVTGAQVATWTVNDGPAWDGCIATFKAAAAQAGPGNRANRRRPRYSARWAHGSPGYPYQRPHLIP